MEHLFLTDTIARCLEIFATWSFITYLVLQIMHSRYMWYVYIPSCIAAALNFFDSATWAFASLNIYYVVMGVVGIVSWRRDSGKLDGSQDSGKGAIPLNRLDAKTFAISLAMAAAGIPALFFLLRALDDPNPFLDAFTTTLSVIGTWWLTKSYIQQWWIWIVADVFAIWMNVNLGNGWFVFQFAMCILSSFVGLWNWNRNGKYVS